MSLGIGPPLGLTTSPGWWGVGRGPVLNFTFCLPFQGVFIFPQLNGKITYIFFKSRRKHQPKPESSLILTSWQRTRAVVSQRAGRINQKGALLSWLSGGGLLEGPEAGGTPRAPETRGHGPNEG